MFGSPLSSGPSYEHKIACMDRRGVAKRDDLVRSAAVVVDLPMCGVVLCERRSGAITDKPQRVPSGRALTVKVENGIAVGLSNIEHKRVIARMTDEHVGSCS